MKISRVWILVIVLALVSVSVMLKDALAQPATPTRPAFPATTKVGVCDIIQVFNQYRKAQDLTEQLKKRRDATRLEDDRKKKAIEEMNLRLEGLKAGTEDYEKVLNDVQRMALELKAWQQFEEAMIMREHHRLTGQMYEDINRTIEAVANDRGIQIVLYSESQLPPSRDTQQLLQMIERRKVLFSDGSVDITEEVLTRANNAYGTAVPM